MAAGRLIAVIPARGGSKAIPRKNALPIAGKPLVAWVVESALAAESVDEVVVSTDDAEIAAIAVRSGAKVHDRSADSATDGASTEMVLHEVLGERPGETYALLQATSPLTTPADIDGAVALLREGGYDSVLSVAPQARFAWTDGPDGAQPWNYDPRERPRRQDLAPLLMENGAIYVSGTDLLRTSGSRLAGKIGLFAMDPATYHELDEPEDWAVVEGLLRLRHATPGAPSDIRLVMSDVDGVLTDNGMYWASDGTETKKFSARDGKGFERLHGAGIRTALLTSESRELVRARGEKLGCHAVELGCKDKVVAAQRLIDELGIDWSQTAFIGDDVHDVGLLSRAGWSAAPADAVPEAREAATVVMTRDGGDGCFRELAEAILRAS